MIGNIFQYLQDIKGKPIPFVYKLFNNLLTEDELTINCNLDLTEYRTYLLPNNLTIHGHLYIATLDIYELPNNLIVYGNLDMSGTEINELPDSLIVTGKLFCHGSKFYNRIKKNKKLKDYYYSKYKIC